MFNDPIDTKPIDTVRVLHAAVLYNSAYYALIEAGWTEELEPSDCFWPEGKPNSFWRHPQHPGAWQMGAALVVVYQSYPKRS